MFDSINVLGEPLAVCSCEPMTGFFRDGSCNTDYQDRGIHTVCCQVTQEFLDYSKSMGNDLSSDKPQFGFIGLKDGDKWCLCAGRWVEAYKAGKAPRVVLEATHEETLAIIPLEVLKAQSL